MAMKEGYTQSLREAYVTALENNLDTIWWEGREVSTAYAKYLLEFEDTVLKPLENDNICNTDNESE